MMKRGALLKPFLITVIAGATLLWGLSKNLHSQEQEIVRGKPGEKATLTVRTESLNLVTSVDAVKIGERQNGDFISMFDAEVRGHEIKSDKVMSVYIIVPAAPPRRYTVGFQLSGENFKDHWIYADFDIGEEDTEKEQTTPEIEVSYDGNTIELGEEPVIDFGTTLVGSPDTTTFTIKNAGRATLTLSNPQSPPGFRLVGSFPDSIAPVDSAFFEVQLDADSAKTFEGILRFDNNDRDESPFEFQITGIVSAAPVAEIEVFDAAIPIITQTSTVDFGTTIVDSAIIKTFTIRNVGTATLTLDELELPPGFRLVGSFPDSIAPADSKYFEVQLDADSEDTFGGTLKFDSNDGDESPFDFQITGRASLIPAAEIEVLSVTKLINSRQTIVDYGSNIVGSDISKTFTVRNIGMATLALSELELPPGFRLVGSFPDSVAAGGSESFAVQLAAGSIGTFSGAFQFRSNDSDEIQFNIQMIGAVIAAPSPFEWVPIIVITAGLITAIGGFYLLIRRVPRMKKAFRKPIIEFNPEPDLGSQRIDRSTPIKPDFKLRLRPVLDSGKQDIQVMGALILKENSV
jgi:hypothetical protein